MINYYNDNDEWIYSQLKLINKRLKIFAAKYLQYRNDTIGGESLTSYSIFLSD